MLIGVNNVTQNYLRYDISQVEFLAKPRRATIQVRLTYTEIRGFFLRVPGHAPIDRLLRTLAMLTYTITDLAREFEITARAIRFYEDQGLLSPTREGAGGRSRVYSPRDRTRLKLTLRGKRLGLALSEIKSLVDMYETPKDTHAQMHRFLGILAQHRLTLEQQREDIDTALSEISAHEDECKRLLSAPASLSKLATPPHLERQR